MHYLWVIPRHRSRARMLPCKILFHLLKTANLGRVSRKWKRPSREGRYFNFAYNFIASHTDAVLRKVLKAWLRKVSGSKLERISRAFLYLHVRITVGEEEAEVFGKCRKPGLCLFRDYEDWLNENKGSCGSLMDVPPDKDLMQTFKQVEVSHWEELEALAEQRRQMGEDGELSDEASGSVWGSGYRVSADVSGGSRFGTRRPWASRLR